VRGELAAAGLRIVVDDSGPGIDPSVLRKVFDPYVTTRSGGTGLGLAIVKKIVMEHQGRIEATRGPLGGARLCIELPQTTTFASNP